MSEPRDEFLSEEDLDRILSLMTRCGSISYAMDRARTYIAAAKHELQPFEDGTARRALTVAAALSYRDPFVLPVQFAADAPWGSLQVAGDDGAPPIPVGGGEGFAGNANAVSSRFPAANTDRLVYATGGRCPAD